jgi:hypothetical protein
VLGPPLRRIATRNLPVLKLGSCPSRRGSVGVDDHAKLHAALGDRPTARALGSNPIGVVAQRWRESGRSRPTLWTTAMRKHRSFAKGLANCSIRPFAALEDRSYERAGRATKRSSADGVGYAGSDPRRSELRTQVNAKRGSARLRPGRLSVLLALTICRDPKKRK